MTATSTRTALMLLLLGLSRPAAAGPGDTPLPTFADGKPAQAVYVALGVIKNNNLETDVVCTSLDGSPVDIGFQVFDETGALRNNVAAPGTLCNGGTRSGLAWKVGKKPDTRHGRPGAGWPAGGVVGGGGSLPRRPGGAGAGRTGGDPAPRR